MPQPLSRFAPNAGLSLATGNTPHSLEMASAAFGVINLWAQIEHTYSGLLSVIAKADPITVTAVYQAIVNADARKAALIAAAKSSLAVEDASLLQAVIEACKASRQQRNDFAHQLWGSINGRTDCVLLWHPKVAATFEAGIVANPQAPPEIDRSCIMVYQMRDFDDALVLARKCHNWTQQLRFIVRPGPATGRRHQVLLEDPQIARLYERYLLENKR